MMTTRLTALLFLIFLMQSSDKHIPQSHRLFWRRTEREREKEGRMWRRRGAERRRGKKRIEGGKDDGRMKRG